jgi:hypothetical protein
MEPLSAGITDENATQIDWEKTPDEVVEGVEAVFSTIREQEDSEEELLTDLFDKIKEVAEIGGEALEIPILAGAAGTFAPFAAIGAGYYGAAQDIKRKRSPIAFAEGVVMGVMAESRSDFIHEKFWMDEPGKYDFEYGGEVEQYYNNGALLLGLAQGKELQERGLGQVFWEDIKRAGGSGVSMTGDEEDWNDWRDFYTTIAGRFVKLHIPEAWG